MNYANNYLKIKYKNKYNFSKSLYNVFWYQYTLIFKRDFAI